MDKIQIIVNLIVAIVGLIPTLVSVFYLIRNIIENKNWSIVIKVANEAMTTVEIYSKTHPEMKSKDKLDMAIKAITASLTAAGIQVDDKLIEQVVAYITEMCQWAKSVNA